MNTIVHDAIQVEGLLIRMKEAADTTASPVASDELAVIASVMKAGSLLSLFTTRRPLWTTGDLAAASGISRPTTHRMLTSLQALGFVRRTDGGEWALGVELVRLGSVASRGDGLRERVRPYLQGMVTDPGDSAYLFVPIDGRVLCVDRVMGSTSLRLSLVEVGGSVRMGKGSVARVVAAFGSPTTKDLRHYSTEELAEVKRRGYALNLEELAPGVCAVAAPLLGAGQALAGAICMGGLRDRFYSTGLDAICARVLGAADTLSQQLGFGQSWFPTPTSQPVA